RQVLRQEGVQEGGTRAGKPGDEDRPLDRLSEDVGPPSLFLAQPQQVGQEAYCIPVCRETSEEGQVPLHSAGTQKFPERLLEGRVAEISKSGAVLGAYDQRIRGKGFAPRKQGID